MQYSYLALGDSYTIGEAVLLAENFPYQAVQLLRKNAASANSFLAPEIIAKTGWTTDELNAAMEETVFLKKYDIVSLLIGVNNQYRGKSVEAFEKEFTGLLDKAIAFAGNMSRHVFILSIPDWGTTPFAAGRDMEKIAVEIDQYNAVCKRVSKEHDVNFIDITTSQRADAANAEMLAGDGLHPSVKEYRKWAALLSAMIIENLGMDNLILDNI